MITATDPQYHLTIFDVKDTPSHMMVSLHVRPTLGQFIEIELTDEDLVITGRGPKIKTTESPSVYLKVKSDQFALAARYVDGDLIIALPKHLHRSLPGCW
jgi:hypothetical protein